MTASQFDEGLTSVPNCIKNLKKINGSMPLKITLSCSGQAPILLNIEARPENAMLIGSYHILALEHHLPVQCVVPDPSQGRRRLPLRQARMNLRLHQTEDEIQANSWGDGY